MFQKVLSAFLKNYDKAKKLLEVCNYNLKSVLSDTDFLLQYITKEEIALIKNAFLLVKQSNNTFAFSVKAKTTEDFFNIFKGYFVENEDYERFYVAYLTGGCTLKAVRLIGEGSASKVDISISKIFGNMPIGTRYLLLCHNHPSGNLHPSQDDFEITKKIVNAAKGTGIKVLDHTIIHKNNYYSFCEHQKI